MLTKSVLTLAALALVSTAVIWAQGSGKRQQGFTNCDVDLRPSSRAEVQVYWTPAPSPNNGVQYQLWVAQDDMLRMGFPDGTEEIYLKKGVPNTVTFNVDATHNPPTVTIALCNEADVAKCPVKGPTGIPLVGSYNRILPIVDPTEQEADPEPSNKERRLITGGRYGLEFSFTLSVPK